MTWEEWLISEYSSFEEFSNTYATPRIFIDGQWFEIMYLQGKFEKTVSTTSNIISEKTYILVKNETI